MYLKQIVLREHAAAAISGDDHDRLLGFSRFMTAHLFQQREVFHALMRGQGGAIFLDMVRDLLCDILRQELVPDTDRLEREVTAQFVIGGYLAVLAWWLGSGANQPPDAIEAAFRKVALDGLALVGG